MNANRSRSPQDYPLPGPVVTQLACFGGQDTPTGALTAGFASTSTSTLEAPAPANEVPGLAQIRVLRAVPVYRPQHLAAALGGTDEGRPQVLVNRLLGDPERTTDSYGF
jgi:hypothetical protein